MARYTTSGTKTTIASLNTELEKIATAQAELLSRAGASPNQMEAALDMNSKQIINLPFPSSETSPLRKKDVNFEQSVDVGIPPTYFNVVAYGAVGDGITPCNVAFQAAFDAASESGGIVFIPAGIYRRANTVEGVLASEWEITGDNVKVQGEGDCSIIFFDDRADEGRADLLRFSGDNAVADSFKIEGTARLFSIPTGGNYSQCMVGSGITRLRINNVSIEAVHYMATAFNTCDDVLVTGCRLADVVRDGYRFTGSKNVRIVGNYAKNVADDVVAIHSLDSLNVVENVIVDGNIFEATQGMKFLGAKNIIVTNNIMHRSTRAAVWIANTSETEGNTNMHSIKIVDNIFADTYAGFGTNVAVQIIGRDVAPDANGDIGAFNTIPYPYNFTNAIDDNLTPVMPIQRLEIRGNNFVRTLPNVADYSEYGYGDFWERLLPDLSAIPPSSYTRPQEITDSNYSVYAIQLNASCQTVQIENNNFDGGRLAPLRIIHNDRGIPLNYQNLLIKNNNFTNTGATSGAIIQLVNDDPTLPNSSNVEIVENYFNGDPYYTTSQHNADNTWVGDSSFTAILQTPTNFLSSVLVSKNTFRNVSSTGISFSSGIVVLEPNIIYSDYTSSTSSPDNKGVRVPPEATGNIIVKIDGDPTSPTFEQTVHFPISTATSTSFPLTGFWAYGHYIRNRAPSPITDPNSGLYIVTGWVKGSTNSTGAVNTDATGFYELRNFVQNVAP